MAWETVERNERTAALAVVRETRSLAVMKAPVGRFAVPAEFGMAAFGALFGAATNYLLIRARGIRAFQGFDPASQAAGSGCSNDRANRNRSLVGPTIVAANAHNTYPWMFCVNPGRIDLNAGEGRNVACATAQLFRLGFPNVRRRRARAAIRDR
jgi:hypothetical protein